MASKQTYECFTCKKNGFPDTRVYLDGKTEDGKTFYKNPDMTPHQHRVSAEIAQKQQQQSAAAAAAAAAAEDKSVDNGISAFSMVTNLTILMEQTQKVLVSIDNKLDRLLNLAERK